MTANKKIEVMIDGRNFTVVGGEDEEYVRNLAYYIDKKIRNLTSKNERLSQTMAATLAALNIADELHKTNSELKKLKDKAKGPLEEYDSLCVELEESKEKVQELRGKCKEYTDLIEIYSKEKEEFIDKIKGLEIELESKNKEVETLKEEIEGLQDRNFKNQVELVEVKKELTEYVRLLDKETSTF
ncbi:MAG: cell division protein ZapA [Tissierellaceae bacterium]